MALKDTKAEKGKQWQHDTAPNKTRRASSSTSVKCSVEQPTKGRQTESSLDSVNAIVRDRVRHLLPAINFKCPRTPLKYGIPSANVLQPTTATGTSCFIALRNRAIAIPTNTELPKWMDLVPNSYSNRVVLAAIRRSERRSESSRFPRPTTTVSSGAVASTPTGLYRRYTRNLFKCKRMLGCLVVPKPAKEYRVPNSTPVHGMKQSTVEIPLRTPTFKYSMLKSQQIRPMPGHLFPNSAAVRECRNSKSTAESIVLENIAERGHTKVIPENDVPKPSSEMVLSKPETQHSQPVSTSEHGNTGLSKSMVEHLLPRPIQKLEFPVPTLWRYRKIATQTSPYQSTLMCRVARPVTQPSPRDIRKPKDEIHTESQNREDDVTFHWTAKLPDLKDADEAGPREVSDTDSRWRRVGTITPASLTPPHIICLPPLSVPSAEQYEHLCHCGCPHLPERTNKRVTANRRRANIPGNPSALVRRRWNASTVAQNQRKRLNNSAIDKTVKQAQYIFNQDPSNRALTQKYRRDRQCLFKTYMRELSKRLRRVYPKLSQSITDAIIQLS